jgi:hypothetical protein
MFKVLNACRIHEGALGSTDEIGNHGAFLIPYQSFTLRVIASDGMGWEHGSVSLPNRCPNWREICFIKDVCWEAEEVFIPYHPFLSSIQIPYSRWIFLWC